jgi:hypothetical protein
MGFFHAKGGTSICHFPVHCWRVEEIGGLCSTHTWRDDFSAPEVIFWCLLIEVSFSPTRVSLLISGAPWSFIRFCQWARDAETQPRHGHKDARVYPGVAGHVRRCRRIAAVASEDFLSETAYTVEVRTGPVHNLFPRVRRVELKMDHSIIFL